MVYISIVWKRLICDTTSNHLNKQFLNLSVIWGNDAWNKTRLFCYDLKKFHHYKNFIELNTESELTLKHFYFFAWTAKMGIPEPKMGISGDGIAKMGKPSEGVAKRGIPCIQNGDIRCRSQPIEDNRRRSWKNGDTQRAKAGKLGKPGAEENAWGYQRWGFWTLKSWV